MNWKVKTFDELDLREFHDILRLRIDVFVVEQDCPYPELDGKDEKAWHLFGTENEKIVVYARMFKPGDYYKQAAIGRVVVHPDFRKKQLGHDLIARCISFIEKDFNTSEIKIGAQTYLEDFYKQLKRHQGLKKDFVFKTPRRSVLYIRKWVMMLFQNKIIDAYKFLDNEHIDVDIKQIHDATWFIQGFWLEIFLRSELAQLMRAYLPHIKTFDILAQAHLVLPGDFSSEIDLLLMLNDKVYWFECKSGNIGEYYKKFKKEKHLMKLPMNHSFLVMPDMDANRDLAVKKQAEMTPLHADNINKELKKHIFDKLTTNATR